MAFASAGSLGTAQEKSIDSGLTLTTTATLPVGNLALVAYATDNIATTPGETSLVSSVTDSAGNTWTLIGEYTQSVGAVGDGTVVSLWYTVATNQLTSGGTITITQVTDTNAKAASGHHFTIGTAGVMIVDYTVNGGESSTVPDISLSGLPSSTEYLFAHALAVELPGTGSYTEDADYTSISGDGTTGGGGATNQSIRGGYRIATLTGDTVGVSISNNTSTAHVLVAIAEDAGGSSIEGSLAVTLADATLTATGELFITGTTAATLGAATLVAAGELPIAGQVTAVLEPAELSATGSLALEGTLTVTLEPATLDAAGSLTLEGQVIATLEAATLEAAGALALTGALDTALDDAILLATGVTGEAVTGSLDVLLDDATLLASAQLPIAGVLSATLDPATLNADGTLSLSGALLATLDPAILNADGTLNLTAALSATLDPAVLTADGRLAIVGQLAATLADAVLVATGSGPVLVVVEGAVRSPGRAASIQSPPNTSIIYSEVGHV